MSANILLVDDDEKILSVFTKVLENEGYSVASAHDGYKAMEEIESQDFHLAVVDITMPGPNGIEILKHIKSSDKNTEVIMISGYASLETAIEAMRQGAYDYIVKPLDIKAIPAAVARGLQKQRQAIETKQLLTQLEQKTFELAALHEVRDAIGYTLDYRELIEPTMCSLRRIIAHDASAFLFMTDEGQGELTIWLDRNAPPSVSDQLKLNTINAFNSVVADGVLAHDIPVHERKTEEYASVEGELPEELRSFLNVAMVIGDMEEVRLAGMISISSHKANAFDTNASRLFYNIANNMSNALEKLTTVVAGEKSKLEMMVRSMTDGVMMFDQRGRMAVLNPAARRMLALEDTIDAEHLAKRIGNTRLSRALDRIWNHRGAGNLVLGDDGFEEEMAIGGSRRVLSANVSPINGDDGRTYGIVALLRDITRQKEIDEAKSAFVSSVSHELRTPLTAVKNAISIVDMAGEVNEQQQRFLYICERNIERLGRLINDILDFSKLEDGKLEMDFGPVDLKALAQESIGALQDMAARKSIDIVLNIPDNLPMIYGDHNRLDQVFTNILDNARKYTPENGQITVEARLVSSPYNVGSPMPMPQILPDPGFVEVSISDTGEGISPEDQKRIFGVFEQAGQTYELGVGLGLSIVKKITENHYGKIWVESELNKGSKFAFVLPLDEKCQQIVRLVGMVDDSIEIAKTDRTTFSLILIQMENPAGVAEEHQNRAANQILTGMADDIQHNTAIEETVTYNSEDGDLIFCLYEGDRDAADIAERIYAFVHKSESLKAGSGAYVNARTWVATYPDDRATAVALIDAVAQNSMSQMVTSDR
ncbi:response regulator [Candidatus Poribacteria bacterium]